MIVASIKSASHASKKFALTPDVFQGAKTQFNSTKIDGTSFLNKGHPMYQEDGHLPTFVVEHMATNTKTCTNVTTQ